MEIQRDELLLREEARAAADAVTHPVQSRQAIDAIALEVVTHGIGVNLQDLRYFLCRPAGRKRHYRLDAVGLAFVLRTAMCRTQFIQLLR